MTASILVFAPPVRARFQVHWPGFDLRLDLTLPGRGVTAFFGPSGSGKTTLLRCIAGLEIQGQGWLDFKGEVWQDSDLGLFIAPHRRPLGYVFQEASLFPHLSVRGNVDYGRRRAHRSGGPFLSGLRGRFNPCDRPPQEIGPGPDVPPVALEQVIDLLGIGHLLDRMPDRLSGGERQRVAIARALATQPRLLLMDEPLAALDHPRKAEILPYLERLHDELAIPVFYVSHSREEVARLADHILVLEAGRLVAAGSAAAILARLDLSLARDQEASCFLDGRVLNYDSSYELLRIQVLGAQLWVPGTCRPLASPARVRIQARDVSIALTEPGPSSILNVFRVRVLEIGPVEGPRLLVKLRLGIGGEEEDGAVLLASITRLSRDRLALTPGQAVYAQVKAVALME